MSLQVAVLVRLDARGSGLGPLTKALDAQTLPPEHFEVLLIDNDVEAPSRTALSELAQRRPNVRVVSADVAEQLATTTADWVVLLDAGDVSLRPAALEKLYERGDTAGSDLVLGRVDLADGLELHDVLARDADDASVTADVIVSSVVLQRRTFALAHGLIVDRSSAQAALAGGPRVSTLGAYQCASRKASGAGVARTALTITSAEARWRSGALEIDVSGTAAPDTDGHVLVLARALSSRNDHVLPVEYSVDADGTFVATARLAPAVAADGAPLAAGRWAVTAGVHGGTDRLSSRVAVPRVSGLGSAVMDGTPYVVEHSGDQLTLDVGALKTSVVGRVSAGDVVITESHRGTLLRARLPRVSAPVGDAVVGQLLLGKFVLPARIVAVDGAAHLESWVSALAGRSTLSTRFGGTTASTGLALIVSGTGQMTVQTERASAAKKPGPKAPAKSAAGTTTPASPQPDHDGAARRLRAALPGRLDPLIARIARNPAAVRIYRKAAGLPPL